MTAPEWFPPLAPLPTPEGTIFRVFSRREGLRLQLYDGPADSAPSREIALEAARHRQGDLWEVSVEGARPGQLYTWAANGRGPLLDPYGLAVSGPARFGADDPARPRPPLREVNADATFKSVVVAPPPEEPWRRPRTAWHEQIVYELNVRGFTRAGGEGTYRALAEKASYLRDLGVTAVELLPVHEFDELEVRRGDGLVNLWGYSPVAWLAPMRRFAGAAADPLGPIEEFRAMVRALHAAGLRVVVDVVFNHTAELDSEGPTWSLRGLDADVYYLHELRTGEYADLTGCGNTVRAQHPAVRALIRHALRWWVHGLGVDGFRFDLAAVLTRDINGNLVDQAPLLREIEEDYWLRDAFLIAEAWDGGGGYRVANWPGGPRWAVWNDRFRDDVRRAWLPVGKADARVLGQRLAGSPDLFGAHGPARGVNYVTAHDGFTLRDAVSYARKHNEANGEENRDGHEHEVSANFGVEGPTDDPGIRAQRDRARRNLVATLLLARGVPMLLAGDELGRTQRGNNNAYCHDGPLTWVDWGGLDGDRDFHRFFRGMIALRRRHPALAARRHRAEGDVAWLGPEGGAVDWSTGAFGCRQGAGLLVLVNLGEREVSFRLPEGAWRLAADTAAPPPADLPPADAAAVAGPGDVRVAARALAAYEAAAAPGA